jgi:hypothetical protein
MKDMNQEQTVNWILRTAVMVLAGVVSIVVLVMMIGIFLPNEQISNDKILDLIGPAFNTVIGAFVGLLGGLSLNSNSSSKATPPQVNTLPPANPSPPVAPYIPPTWTPPAATEVPTVAPTVPVLSTNDIMNNGPVTSSFNGKPAPVQPEHPEI